MGCRELRHPAAVRLLRGYRHYPDRAGFSAAAAAAPSGAIASGAGGVARARRRSGHEPGSEGRRDYRLILGPRQLDDMLRVYREAALTQKRDLGDQSLVVVLTKGDELHTLEGFPRQLRDFRPAAGDDNVGRISDTALHR